MVLSHFAWARQEGCGWRFLYETRFILKNVAGIFWDQLSMSLCWFPTLLDLVSPSCLLWCRVLVTSKKSRFHTVILGFGFGPGIGLEDLRANPVPEALLRPCPAPPSSCCCWAETKILFFTSLQRLWSTAQNWNKGNPSSQFLQFLPAVNPTTHLF